MAETLKSSRMGNAKTPKKIDSINPTTINMVKMATTKSISGICSGIALRILNNLRMVLAIAPTMASIRMPPMIPICANAVR